jgi:ABC-type antimicrobial peptide transport system permease subunit
MQPVRRLLAEADPRLSFVEVASLATEVADSIWPERAAAWLASVFAGAAMVIVAAGLYALAAFAVMQRRREIGIRMALGALPGDILRLMLARVTWLSLGGVAVGLFCSWLIAPQVQSVLYEVRPRDPRSLFGAVAVVLGVTMLAAMLPSLRAARMAPPTVLRDE